MKWSRGPTGDVVLALGIGALTSTLIVAFLETTEKLGQRLYPHMGGPLGRFLVPTLGALLAGYLVARYFPEARGSGIPQTKAALVARDGYISVRTVVGKFLCCSISLGSGISLGREGPSVQMGAGLASIVGRRLGLENRQVKALLPVGTAAALAAAFNTPIAAVLFTLEEVLGDLHARVLGTVVLSSATSWMVLHLFLGDAPLFRVPNYQLVHPAELLIYAVVGVIGGFMSVGFVRLTLWLRAWFMTLPKKTVPWQPALGGLAVGVLAIFLPGVLGVGYAFVDEALSGSMALKVMILLLLLKLPLTAICYATGNPGGIFGPSLFLGAMLGGAAGSIVHQLWPAGTAVPGAYALVGMGTAFAGIIRTPLTSVIMIFELTRDYSIIVPLMISNLLSFYISHKLQPVPIYEALAEQEGIHLPRSPERREEPDFRVFNAMRPPGPQVEEIVRNASDLHVEAFPHVHPDHPLDLVLHRLGEANVELLPVVDRTNPRKVLGEIALEDLLRCYRMNKTASYGRGSEQ